MLGIFAVGIAQFIILYLFTRLLGAYWGQSLGGVILLAIGTLVSTTGLSILFAAIAKTRRALGAIAPLVISWPYLEEACSRLRFSHNGLKQYITSPSTAGLSMVSWT